MAYLRLSDSAACEDAHVYHRESRASWSGHAPATESLDRAVMCWRWHSSTACSASTDAEASGVSGLPLWMMAASRMVDERAESATAGSPQCKLGEINE